MKTFKLENEPKIKSGFKTPENYFEDFSARIIQQLPKENSKTIPLFKRKKAWIYSVAAVLIIALTLPIYNNYFKKKSEIDNSSLENYITYHTSISDADLVNLLDKNDIQKMNIDLNIQDKTIEDEFSANSNLEYYLLN